MKRILKILCLIFAILSIVTFPVFAEESGYEKDTNELYEKYDSNGEIRDLINSDDPYNFFNVFIEYSIDSAFKIVPNICYILAILLITSLISGIRPQSSLGVDATYTLASTLAILSIIAFPAIKLASASSELLIRFSDFLNKFIPIFCGIMLAQGKIGGSAAYSATMLALCEVVSFVSKNIIVPLIIVFIGLSVASAISDSINLSGLLKVAKTFSSFILSTVFAVFTATLTLKSTVAAAGDSLAIRGVKLAVNSFVPVIGGALSEALNSASGYIDLLKGTAGVFAIIFVAIMFLPIILQCSCWQITLSIGGALAEIFGHSKIKSIMEDLKSVFSILLAVVACFSLISIIATGSMLLITKS